MEQSSAECRAAVHPHRASICLLHSPLFGLSAENSGVVKQPGQVILQRLPTRRVRSSGRHSPRTARASRSLAAQRPHSHQIRAAGRGPRGVPFDSRCPLPVRHPGGLVGEPGQVHPTLAKLPPNLKHQDDAMKRERSGFEGLTRRTGCDFSSNRTGKGMWRAGRAPRSALRRVCVAKI